MLLALGLPAEAQTYPITACNDKVPYGAPLARKDNSTIICRSGYLLEHDNRAKIPVWVSYVLTPDHATGCFPRTNSFTPDYSLIPRERAELKDYAKSGFDIGHQANDGDMSWSLESERESFILSNMAPQLPGFNRGIWKKLEDQTRAWAVTRQNPLLIYVGPIYSEEDRTIGRNGVVVPHAFYKVITDTVTNEALVFQFKHEATQGNLNLFITSLASVQQQTGVIFFVPKDVKFMDRIWPSVTKSARRAKKGICEIK
jgi:endonuclease G